MKTVVVLADAARDLELGRDFYDAQALGIGDYFADSLLSDLESLRLFHGIHSRHFGFHRMLASRFPFGIYYDETANEVQVFAVLDLRRDPLWLRRELTGR
ncbi:MAG: type II toxin-antitoxin system RelE/ParE family toxin [Chthoniobacteraceae bacterium]